MSEIKTKLYMLKRELPPVIEYTQGTNVVQLRFQFEDYTLPNAAEARIYMKKPSGKEVYNKGNIDGNDAIFYVTEQMTAEAGRIPMQVRISGIDTEEIINSFPVVFHVFKSPYMENKIPSTNEFREFEALIDKAEEVALAGTQMMEMVGRAEDAAGEALAHTQRAASEASRAEVAASGATKEADTARAQAGRAEDAAGEALAHMQRAASEASRAEVAARRAEDAAILKGGLPVLWKGTMPGWKTTESMNQATFYVPEEYISDTPKSLALYLEGFLGKPMEAEGKIYHEGKRATVASIALGAPYKIADKNGQGNGANYYPYAVGEHITIIIPAEEFIGSGEYTGCVVVGAKLLPDTRNCECIVQNGITGGTVGNLFVITKISAFVQKEVENNV